LLQLAFGEEYRLAVPPAHTLVYPGPQLSTVTGAQRELFQRLSRAVNRNFGKSIDEFVQGGARRP
jgi:hypothetical protein